MLVELACTLSRDTGSGKSTERVGLGLDRTRLLFDGHDPQERECHQNEGVL